MTSPSPPQQQRLLLSGDCYNYFINSLKSIETQKQYSYCLRNYMKFAAVNKTDDLFFSSPKEVEQRLINYCVYLRNEKKVVYSTRNLYLASALCFYVMNDILVNKKKIYRYLDEKTRARKDRAYTTQEISTILEKY